MAADSGRALAIDDLVIEYTTGDYKIRPIDGLSLRAEPGSLVLLLGPSGSGKTSLLSCIGGILTPTSGSIRFGDTDVTALGGGALTEYRRRTVGIVFQAFNLIASLTAVENVAAPMRAARIGRRDARARAVELLESVGLGDRLHHRPGRLSGGQQQRVAVARALALDPPLILADEPTAHLDYIQVEGLLRLIRQLADEGRVVVVSTHDERMIPLADHVVEMVPELADAEGSGEPIVLFAGDVLFRQGSRGTLVYTINEGEIAIVREHADGEEELLASLGVGEYFGELGPFLGLPRSATARARTNAMVTGYTTRDFRRHVGHDDLPEILRRHRGGAGARDDVDDSDHLGLDELAHDELELARRNHDDDDDDEGGRDGDEGGRDDDEGDGDDDHLGLDELAQDDLAQDVFERGRDHPHDEDDTHHDGDTDEGGDTAAGLAREVGETGTPDRRPPPGGIDWSGRANQNRDG